MSSSGSKENHLARSSFVRKLVQSSPKIIQAQTELLGIIPKRIVHFWDDLDRLPSDVCDCIETWRRTEEQGFDRILFDTKQARAFIHQKLGLRHLTAFDKCYHPAMQSDYFRLCYIFVEGGCYVDSDDVYSGAAIEHLFNDERLKVQPLCYDTVTNMMVPPHIFTQCGANAATWIFYFNNNPLIACRRHFMIKEALAQATLSLEQTAPNGLPEIQSTTGPGNLTKSIFQSNSRGIEVGDQLLVLTNWEDVVSTKWDLSYRNDERNWRLSNSRRYAKP